MKFKDLDGAWELCPVNNFPSSADDLTDWIEMDVPSHWQQHPKLESYAGKMVYRKRFSIRKKKGASYRVVLPGTFYWSTVFFNGKKLGDHEGYFAPQSYDVTSLIKGKNELVVYVNCPEEKAKNNKRMITGVFSHWDCLDPKTNPGGIWLAPEIHRAEGGFVDNVFIHTERIRGKKADQVEKVLVTSEIDGPGKIRITYKPSNFEGQEQSFEEVVQLKQGANRFDFTHTLKDPALWWTHDMGDQNMYDVEVALLTEKGRKIDEYKTATGVRTIEQQDYIFYLNDKRLYLKGNNYPPSDTRIATATEKLCNMDMELAKGCHMNILRVHAHVDHPELYKAADKAGVLLWQDFPLQWSYRKETMPVAQQQIGQMVDLLYNHPSIAIWCCHNEPIYLVDTKDEDLANISKSLFTIFAYSWNRDVMDVRLKQVAQSHDPSRFVMKCSGEPAFLRKGGDTHFYFGWYRVQGPKRMFDKIHLYAKKNLRLVSEFGAQSLPNLESCKKMMNEDISKIDWQELQERNSLQIDLLDHWVGLNKSSLGELVEESQEYQSRLNQYYIDRIRHRKYEPSGGVLPFMFTDPNPAIQWSIVDYWRVPKQSYYAMKKAFAPQYAFVLLSKDDYIQGDREDVSVYVVNDAHKAFKNVNVHYTLTGPGGSTVTHHCFTTYLPADSLSIRIGRVPEYFGESGKYMLNLKIEHPDFALENDYPIEVK